MKKIVNAVIALLLVVTTALVTYIVTVTGDKPTAFQLLRGEDVGKKAAEIGMLLDQYYVDDFDPITLGDAAAAAMLYAAGDRWASYVPAKDALTHQQAMSNAYVGIGVSFQVTDTGTMRILEVQPNSPALTAGLQSGDAIVSVDGTPVRGMTTDQIKDMVRGEPGTDVSLTVLRKGKTITSTMRRAEIIDEVSYGVLMEDIGYICINNFEEHAAEQAIDAMNALVEQGARGLVFDVRANPGGFRDELVTLLDHILPAGEIFRACSADGIEDVNVSDASCVSLPMAVLVDQNTYSAAEYFAAALQEYHWAVIVGEKTVGKGNYQVEMPLSDGSSVSFSVGKYYTPQGVSLSQSGVTPDVSVAFSEDEKAALYQGEVDLPGDKQFCAAVDSLHKMFK